MGAAHREAWTLTMPYNDAVQVDRPGPYAKVDLGDTSGCAVTSDGALRCWTFHYSCQDDSCDDADRVTADVDGI